MCDSTNTGCFFTRSKVIRFFQFKIKKKKITCVPTVKRYFNKNFNFHILIIDLKGEYKREFKCNWFSSNLSSKWKFFPRSVVLKTFCGRLGIFCSEIILTIRVKAL
jgi:hypothetical protein